MGLIVASLYMTVAGGTVKTKKEYTDKMIVAIANAVAGYRTRMKAFLTTAAANAYAFGSVPKDTGELLASGLRVIDRSYASGTSFKVFFGFSAPYAAYINYGYPAGTFPPTSALMGWAARHKKPDLTDKQWAFLIARAIFRRGLRGRAFFEPGVRRAKEIFQEELQQSLNFAFPGKARVTIS